MSFKISTGRVPRANSLLLYGVEGVGKTTLCANLPGAFIIDTEGGSTFIDCARAEVDNLDDLRDVFRHILSERKAGRFDYQTVVLDTVDKIWQWCADAIIARTEKAQSIEDIPYGKGYAQASEMFAKIVFDVFINRFKAAGLHVIACAHSKITRISPPDAPEYTQYQVKITAPNKQAEEAANLLRQACDAVIFAHFQTTVKSGTQGAPGKAVGERRVLSTTHSAQWEAKNRVGLPDELDMTAESLAPLFPNLNSIPPTAKPETAPAETPRGIDTPPPSGADPRELGGYARHHGLDTRTAPAPAPAEQPAAQPAAPHYTIPASFRGMEDTLCHYLQSKGKLANDKGADAIPQAVLAVIVKNEAKVLAAVRKYQDEHEPF